MIHHPLANSQVLLYPDVDIFVFGNGILLETGPKVPEWVLLAKVVSQTSKEQGGNVPSASPDTPRTGLFWFVEEVDVGSRCRRSTYVKPVDLFIPARNAETAAD